MSVGVSQYLGRWDIVSLHVFRWHGEPLLVSCTNGLTSSLLKYSVLQHAICLSLRLQCKTFQMTPTMLVVPTVTKVIYMYSSSFSNLKVHLRLLCV